MAQQSIRPQVIKRIEADLSDRFRVIDNTGAEKLLVAGQFPDVLLYRKMGPISNDLLFTLKVENGGELVDSLPQWKELASAPSTFYIVVPQNKLDEAKKLVSATGVKAKFAWYQVAGDDVVKVSYE